MGGRRCQYAFRDGERLYLVVRITAILALRDIEEDAHPDTSGGGGQAY